MTDAVCARAPRQPAPPQPLAGAEPLGVRDERDVVDGDARAARRAQRRGVGRREEHVEPIAVESRDRR